MKNSNWIQTLAESSYQLFIHHDPQSHLPFNAWGLLPYYSGFWLKKVHGLIKGFKESGYCVDDYLDLFPNLSSTRFIILMNTIHYKISGMDDPLLITEIQDFLVTSLKLRAKEDLFAIEKNIDLNNVQLRKLIGERLIRKCNLDESKEIGKILVALASLTHGLYNDWCTDFNYEISGPYYKENKLILIRSFSDMHPVDVWPEIDWDFKEFSIITEYRNLSAKIAFVGCHITYSENAVDSLSGYNFQIDGKKIKGFSELRALREKLMPIAASQYEKFMGLNFEDQKIKYVFQEHYQLKKLFELIDINWRPSTEILKSIKGKNLARGIFENYDMTIEEYKDIFGFNKLAKAYSK